MNSPHPAPPGSNAGEVMEAVRKITLKTRGTTAEDVLQQLTIAIAEVLYADFIFVGKIDEGSPVIQAVAQSTKKIDSETVQFRLTRPLLRKLSKPELIILNDAEVKACLTENESIGASRSTCAGVPLRDSQNAAIGLMIAAFHNYPKHLSLVKDVLQIFATRASVELERLELEKKLTLSEARYRHFFTEDLTGDFVTSPDGRILEANPEFLRIFGFSSLEEAKATPVSRLYQKESDRTQMLTLLRKHRNLKGIEGQALRIDGHPILIRENIAGSFDSDGNLTGIHGYLIDITREHSTVQELRATRKIIEESPAVVFVWRNEPGWPVEFVTENVVKLCGCTAAELKSGNISYADLIHPDDLEKVKTSVCRALDDPNPQALSHMSYRLMHQDGSVVWVNDHSFVQRDETGNVVRFHGVVLDITGQMKMEKALEESQQRYQRLFESAPDAIFLADTKTGIIVDANPAAEQLLRQKRSEIIGMHQSKLHPETPEKQGQRDFQNHVKEALLSGNTRLLRQEVVCSGNRLVPVEIRAEAVEVNGRTLLQGVFRDISERIQAEKELTAREVRYQTLVETSPDPIYVLQGHQLKMVNKAWEKMFGYSREEALSASFDILKIIAPDCLEMVKEKFATPDGKKPDMSHYELGVVTRSGERLDLDVVVAQIEWEGKPAVQGIYRDITEIRNRERELEEQRLRLELAQQVTKIGFFDWDLKKNRILISDEAATMYGLEPEMRLTTPEGISPLVAEEDSKIVDQAIRKTLETGEPYDVVHRVNRVSDGKQIWIHARGHLIVENGCAVRLLGTAQEITEQKEAELRLRDSEEKFRALAESAPVAIMIYQKDQFVYANPGACEITGYSTDELYRMHWWSIVHPKDLETVKKRGRARLNRKDVPNSYEFRILQKNHNVRWMNFTASYIEYKGNPAGIIVGIDITDRKEVEFRLRRNEARLKVLFEQSPVSLWEEDFSEIKRQLEILRKEGISDLQTYLDRHPEKFRELIHSVKITDVNRATLELFHAKSIKHLFRNLRNAPFSEAKRIWIEELCVLFEGGSECASEGIVRTLDGEEIYVHVHFSLPDAYRDTWEKVLVSITDITERYRMETRLKESESKFRAMFDRSSVPFTLEDFSAVRTEIDRLVRNGEKELKKRLATDVTLLKKLAGKVQISSINKAALEFFAIPPEQVEKLTLTDFFTEISLLAFGKQLLTFLNGEKLYTGEGEALIFSGELKYVFVQLSLIESSKGSWNRVLVSIVDLTEKKLLEKEQKKLEAQLRQSQKLETVGTLAGGIAHDFNNLLTPILGYTELLRMKLSNNETAVNYLDRIENASIRARDLVKQMLAFSRNSEEEKVPLQLASVVEEVVQLIRASIPATISIETQVERGLGIVLADETQIHQVIMNLCTNAAQAMPLGGTLTISLKQANHKKNKDIQAAGLKPGTYVVLAVRDTGTGMDEKTIQRAFDPFFTTKEVGKGTGLGLSMVHGVAASHGGGCTVESRPGKGSTFRVYLPVISGSETEKYENKFQNETKHQPGKGRILIVDDDPDVLSLHREVLSGIGYDIHTAENGAAALEAVKSNPEKFDAIVTDLTMPGITGVQLAVEAHKIQKDLPVVLVTGYREELTPEIRSQTGIRKVLMKPVKIQELSEAVREVLHTGRSGGDNRNGK
ncbi:MAG: PAS domain S-box protein [Acidobacteria bacterium]|nr:PAS domain S-box protein [Acidobacteriota bacterium]